jgi:hypothetical protein
MIFPGLKVPNILAPLWTNNAQRNSELGGLLFIKGSRYILFGTCSRLLGTVGAQSNYRSFRDPSGGPPAPPSEPGCYHYDINSARDSDHRHPRWERTRCLSREEASRLPHPTIGGLTAGAYGISGPCIWPCGTSGSSAPPTPITMGFVAISFQQTFPPGPFPANLITDTGTGRNSFSVQLNANIFVIACNTALAGC